MLYFYFHIQLLARILSKHVSVAVGIKTRLWIYQQLTPIKRGTVRNRARRQLPHLYCLRKWMLFLMMTQDFWLPSRHLWLLPRGQSSLLPAVSKRRKVLHFGLCRLNWLGCIFWVQTRWLHYRSCIQHHVWWQLWRDPFPSPFSGECNIYDQMFLLIIKLKVCGFCYYELDRSVIKNKYLFFISPAVRCK